MDLGEKKSQRSAAHCVVPCQDSVRSMSLGVAKFLANHRAHSMGLYAHISCLSPSKSGTKQTSKNTSTNFPHVASIALKTCRKDLGNVWYVCNVCKDSMSHLMFWRPKPNARSSTARAVEPQRRQVSALELSSTSQACNWIGMWGWMIEAVWGAQSIYFEDKILKHVKTWLDGWKCRNMQTGEKRYQNIYLKTKP